MTYRGHAVLRTLIRCHFSPRESTGQSYIYSGSADGMIHIWSLDGRVVQGEQTSRHLDIVAGGALRSLWEVSMGGPRGTLQPYSVAKVLATGEGYLRPKRFEDGHREWTPSGSWRASRSRKYASGPS